MRLLNGPLLVLPTAIILLFAGLVGARVIAQDSGAAPPRATPPLARLSEPHPRPPPTRTLEIVLVGSEEERRAVLGYLIEANRERDDIEVERTRYHFVVIADAADESKSALQVYEAIRAWSTGQDDVARGLVNVVDMRD